MAKTIKILLSQHFFKIALDILWLIKLILKHYMSGYWNLKTKTSVYLMWLIFHQSASSQVAALMMAWGPIGPPKIWRICNGHDPSKFVWGPWKFTCTKSSVGRLRIFLKMFRADSRLAPSQWETLQSNTVSHWLGSNLVSALMLFPWFVDVFSPPEKHRGQIFTFIDSFRITCY